MTFLKKYHITLALALLKFILPFILQHPIYELHRY